MIKHIPNELATALGTKSNQSSHAQFAVDAVRLSPPADAKAVKGEGGPSPAIHVSNTDFMRSAFKVLQEGALAVVCSKAGDPTKGGWQAEPTGAVDEQCPSSRNNYFNCSSFTPNADAKITAQKIQFAAYHALVLDDVGTKVDRARLGTFVPSWILETSPGNFQVGVILKEPLRDSADVEALQSAIVAAGLCDAGAMGVSRWARLPVAINGKPKYGADGAPFACRLHSWKPDVAYSLDEIVKGLSLTLRPPSPSLPVPTRKGREITPAIAEGVYVPKAVENPIVVKLRALGLHKGDLGAGKHEITCPWADEHTDKVDSGTAYFEPNPDYPVGGFRCHHSHGDRLRLGDLHKFLGVSPTDARNRSRIRLVPGEMNSVAHAAERVLADRGRHYQAGGAIVSIQTEPYSGDVRVEAVSEQALTHALAEAADWERYDGRSKSLIRCDPPVRTINMLHKAQSYSALPTLRGLARQPFFREADGVLVMSPGLDPVSGKFASFDPRQFALGEATLAGALEALGRLEKLLEEFHFATDVDRSAALCAMLTATVRPSLPVAPAFNVTASSYGSGKSYLCSTVYPFAGPGDPQILSYPKTSEEASKVILSALLASPATIFFDDMDTDWKPHGVINRMFTSETISERILGVSKTVTVSTRTLVLGSGNNVEPLRDLRRRVISIRLSPRTQSPSMLSYSGKPAEEVKRHRARYVSDALTIIEAWRSAGRPKADVFDIASFNGPWADYCRQPLLWLGQPDPATSLRDQVRSDPDSETLGDFLEAWVKRFGHSAVTVRKVLQSAGGLGNDDLTEALEELPVSDHQGINRSKFGWYLKNKTLRVVRGLQLEPAESSERRAWRVVRVTDELTLSDKSPFAAFTPEKSEKRQVLDATRHSDRSEALMVAKSGDLGTFKWPPAGNP